MTNDRSHSPALNDMLIANSQQRAAYFDQIVNQQQCIWILKDDDGAVMLTTDDEDCLPVWPTQEAAELWRNQEWQDCQAYSIPLHEWQAKWTSGLQSDDLCVVVFPVPGEDGMVIYPDELETLIKH